MKYVALLCLTLGGELLNATERPLKILFMVYSFPTLSATFVMGQIKGMIEKGHEVSIFAQYKSAMKKIHPDIGRYQLLEKTYYKDLPHDMSSYDILYCQFFSLAKDLLSELTKRKAASKKFPKFIVCCRGSDGVEDVSLASKRCQNLFQKTDLFMPVCQHFANLLTKAGCDRKKIIVHHSAIDLNFFSSQEKNYNSDRDILLISIGRLTESKGTKYAIEAFAKLQDKFPMLRYIIVGDGVSRNELQQLVSTYKLEKKVTFVGWCLPQDVAKWLSKADIFVHPSITSAHNLQEGVPNVLMEAMAMGLPVVSTWHGGIPEIVQDRVSGLLVPEKNSAALAENIQYLLEHQDQWPLMQNAAKRAVFEKYNIHTENSKLEHILKDICRG